MFQKTISKDVKEKVEEYINERLGKNEEIQNIFIDQKSKDVFEVLIITKKINPEIERKLVEIEDEIKEKYHIPLNVSTLSNHSIMVTA